MLPALLGRLGDRVDRGASAAGAPPRASGCPAAPCAALPARWRRSYPSPRWWPWRCPWSPHTTLLGPGDLPPNIPVVKTYDQIQKAFPGSPAPATWSSAWLTTSVPQAKAAFAQLKHLALASVRPGADRDHDQRGPYGGEDPGSAGRRGQDRASMAALATLRSKVLPASVGQLPGQLCGNR